MMHKRYFKTKDEVEVTFEHDADVDTVALLTNYNNWEPVKMVKRKKDGVYYARLRLPKNKQFQFRYLVDGAEWVNDQTADGYVPNEHGTQNCVVSTVQS